MNTEQDITWDKIITTKQKKMSTQLKSIWEYRDLIVLLVKRDYVTYYKQTILGPLWYLVQPICSTIMYILVFGTLAQIGTDSIPQPLFYFSGTMLWTYFSGNLINTSNVFFKNKDMFGKVFFPRLVAPIASTISLLVKFGIQFILFLIIYVFYLLKGANITLSFSILLCPFIILWVSLLSGGIGMIISSVTTKYRDIAMVLEFFVSLWVYATPIAYPLSEIPENVRFLFCLNPVSVQVELFRYCFFGTATITTEAVLISLGMTLIFLFLGLKMFNKNERTFIDTI